MQRQAAEVRALGEGPPTPEAWVAARAALSSKFEGIQTVAVRVVGRWGGREAVDTLREFLIETLDRKYGWSIRSVAVGELARLVTAEDPGWVPDLCFGRADRVEKYELRFLVEALPPESARPRLVAELRSPDPRRRLAAVTAIANMAFRDRRQLLWTPRENPHKWVGTRARLLTDNA